MIQEIKEINVEKEAQTPQGKLAEFLTTRKVTIAQTPEELYGPKTEQTQEEIQAEVDEFLGMREEWRQESRESNFDL